MTFDILDKMVGLSVINALDGNIIGVSTRLIFGKKRLNFKYVLVEGDGEDNRMVYLQYPDILRMNDRAILCLIDEYSTVKNYTYYNDPDAFTFVGHEAVDEQGKLIGIIESAQLDADAKVVTFTIRRGNGRAVFGIDRVVEITQNNIIFVHRTDEDVFVTQHNEVFEASEQEEVPVVAEEEPVLEEEVSVAADAEAGQEQEEGTFVAADAEAGQAEAAEGQPQVELISPMTAAAEGEEFQAEPISPVAEQAEAAADTAEEKAKIELVSPLSKIDTTETTSVVNPVPPKKEKKSSGSGGLDIQWGQGSDYASAPASYPDEDFDSGKKKGGASFSPAMILGTFKAMDAVSGIRYVAMVAFFAACILFK